MINNKLFFLNPYSKLYEIQINKAFKKAYIVKVYIEIIFFDRIDT